MDMRVGTLETGESVPSKGRRLADVSAAPAAGERAQAGAVVTAELSRMAVLMNTLQDLERREPARYRLAMGTIASHLGDAAAAEAGGSAELLRALSRKFGEVSGGAAAASTREAAAARAYHAADPRPRQLEEILQTALAEVGAWPAAPVRPAELPHGIPIGKK